MHVSLHSEEIALKLILSVMIKFTLFVYLIVTLIFILWLLTSHIFFFITVIIFFFLGLGSSSYLYFIFKFWWRGLWINGVLMLTSLTLSLLSLRLLILFRATTHTLDLYFFIRLLILYLIIIELFIFISLQCFHINIHKFMIRALRRLHLFNRFLDRQPHLLTHVAFNRLFNTLVSISI
jgi:hypothetical protein